MPRAEILFYQEKEGVVPVSDWLKDLRRSDRQAYAKCAAAIERLAELGNEVRRPLADFLEQGVYELRIRKGTLNYRILYFFHGRNIAVLAHALVKEGRVPEADLLRTMRRKGKFEADPKSHTFSMEDA